MQYFPTIFKRIGYAILFVLGMYSACIIIAPEFMPLAHASMIFLVIYTAGIVFAFIKDMKVRYQKEQTKR